MRNLQERCIQIQVPFLSCSLSLISLRYVSCSCSLVCFKKHKGKHKIGISSLIDVNFYMRPCVLDFVIEFDECLYLISYVSFLIVPQEKEICFASMKCWLKNLDSLWLCVDVVSNYTPCAKPSSTEEKPASPAKEVTGHVEEAKDVVKETQLKAIGMVLPTNSQRWSCEHGVLSHFAVFCGCISSKGSSGGKTDTCRGRKICIREDTARGYREIREALKDEAIRKLICNIDSSSNPLLELDEAMGVEAFRVFTDKILSNIAKSNDEQ
ncbi:unnamed protein product, partial [Thlaspi arvense]